MAMTARIRRMSGYAPLRQQHPFHQCSVSQTLTHRFRVTKCCADHRYFVTPGRRRARSECCNDERVLRTAVEVISHQG